MFLRRASNFILAEERHTSEENKLLKVQFERQCLARQGRGFPQNLPADAALAPLTGKDRFFPHSHFNHPLSFDAV